MNSNKVFYKRFYITFFVILIIGILFLGNYYLSTLNYNYFIEFNTSSDLENTKNGIVYFGGPSCLECRTIEPIIRDIAREEKIKIFYFDTEYIKTTEGIDSSILQKYLLEYQVESVPTIIVMRNGIVVESLNELLNNGDSRKANLLNTLMPYKDLSNYVTPYSNVSRALFGVSVIFLIFSLFVRNNLLSRRIYLPVISFNICMFFFIIRNYGFSIVYIEKYGYGGNTIDSTISLLAMTIIIISNMILVIKIKDKMSDTLS